jgi:phosphate transport system permease protein
MHHFSAWAGGFALSLMMIPIGLRATEQFLRAVPNSLREGSLALGASKTRTVMSVVVPAARQGILTGMILGVARVAGEAAPLLFTSFNNQYWANSLNEPIAALPLMIYYRAISPYDDFHRQAWAAGLVLLVLVLIANIASRWVLSRGASAQRG